MAASPLPRADPRGLPPTPVLRDGAHRPIRIKGECRDRRQAPLAGGRPRPRRLRVRGRGVREAEAGNVLDDLVPNTDDQAIADMRGTGG